MTNGFQQQQDTGLGLGFTKAVATPQHGQKAPPTPLPAPEPRSYKRRPGH